MSFSFFRRNANKSHEQQPRWSSKKRPAFRPTPIESLEERLTPAVYVWDGDAADGKWSTLANWAVLGVDPGTLPSSADDVSFNSVALSAPQQLNTLDGADRSVRSVLVSATAAIPLTIEAGNTLTIASPGITIDPGAEAVTISCALSLAGVQTWTNNSSSLFTTSAISNGAHTLTIDGSGNTTFTGALGNGAGGLTKTGSGTLFITATQTYTGATLIQDGTLNLQGEADRLPIATAVTLGNLTTSGVLKLGEGTTPANQRVSSLLTSGTGTANAVVGGNSGTASVLTIANTVAVNYSGVLGGPNANEDNLALTKLLGGVLTLSGTAPNTHEGLTTIQAGAANLLRFNKTDGVNTFNAIGGDLRIEPTATSVSVQLLAANQIPDTSLVTILGIATVGSGNLNMNNFDETIGSLDIQNGTSTTTITLATGTKTLTVMGSMSFSGGSTGGTVVSGFLNLGGGVRTINSTSTGTATPNISAVISNGGILKDDVGNVILSGANIYTGGTTVRAGALIAGVNNVSTTSGAFGPSTSGVTLGDAGMTNASLLANTFTVSNPVTLGTGALGTLTIGSNGSTAATFSGAISLNGGNVTIASSGATGSFTISGGITGAGNVTIANNATTSTASSITTNPINNAGSITNTGTGGGTVTVSGGVGSNVTLIHQNTNGSPLTISTNAISVNSVATTLRASGNKLLTVSGGIIGTGNLILNNNGATAGAITISTTAVNNTGTITNSGAGSQTVIISGGVGSNVTAIDQNSTTSQLTISTNPITVNAVGTTLSNTLGTAILSLTGGTTGTGHLILKNNSAHAAGITIATTAVGHTGTTTNSGTGPGGTTISAVINTSSTGLIQHSATSSLLLTGANTFSAGTTIKAGTAIAGVSNATNVSGAFGTSASPITLGDSAGSNASLLANSFTVSNPVTLGTNAQGTLTIGNNGGTTAAVFSGSINLNGNNVSIAATGTTGKFTISGGITGVGNVIANNNATTATTSSFTTTAVDNSGTFTNSGTGGGTTTVTGGVGSNVTGITLNSTTSALTISTTALSVNSSGTTLTNATGGTKLLTVSGGVTGSGNLILNNNSDFTNGITLSTTAVNNAGTITNSGTGTGLTLISAPVGADVTMIAQSSTTSAMTVSGAITVNATATTLANTAGTKLLTVTGGTTGTGNLIINNNSDLAAGITVSTTAVGHVGTTTNSGTGAGGTTISAVINANSAGLVQNSATSSLLLTGANLFTSGTIIKAGSAIAGVSNATTVSGAFGTSASPITLGDSAGSSASLLANSFTVSNPITLGTSAVGTLSMGNNGAATAAVFSGPISLNGRNLTISPSGTGSTSITGGITGTGNLTISNGTTTATTTISTNPIDITGSITNAGSGTGNATISAVIGANVTGVTQNGTSSLILTGANLFTSLVTITSGILWAQTKTNLTVLGTGAASIEMQGGELLLGIDSDPVNFGRNVLVTGNAAIRPARTGGANTAGGGDYIFGTLSIGSQNLTIAPNSAGTGGSPSVTFAATTLTGSPTFTVDNPTTSGTTTLLLNGGIELGGADRTITSGGAGALSIAGALSSTAPNNKLSLSWSGAVTIGSVLTGANNPAIEVAGAGTYTFNGAASTYTGGVLLSNASATVFADTASALGEAGSIVKFNVAGTTLQLRRTTATVFTAGLDASAFGGTVIVNRAAAGSGVVHTLSGVNSFGANTVSVVSGNFINSNTAYGLTLSNTSTLNGALTLNVSNNGSSAGTLSLAAIDGSGSMTFSGAGNVTQAGGVWSFGGASSLALSSGYSGAVTLTQVNTLTGGITVDGGIIAFNGADTWNGNVQVNAGGAAWAQVNDATVEPTDTITLNGGILYVGVVSTAMSFNRDVIVTADSTVRVTRNSTASTDAGSHTLGKLTIGGQTLNIDLNSATTSTGLRPATTGTAGITFTSATVTGSPTFTTTNPTTSGTTRITFSGLVTTSGDITVNGNGGGTFSGGFDLAGGNRTLNYNAPVTTTLTGPLSSTAAGNNLTLASTVAMTVGNVLAGVNNPGLILDSPVTYTFNGAAGTFNGGVTINNTSAILAVGVSSVASAGAIVTGPLGTGLLTINGGNIRPSSATDRTLHNSILIANDFEIGNAALNNKLTLDPTQVTGGSITINGSRTMTTLGSGTGASHIFVGPITAGTGTVSLTKAGTTNVVFRNNTTTSSSIPAVDIQGGTYFVEGTTATFMQNALGIASYNIGAAGSLGFNSDITITPTNTMVIANGGNIAYRSGTATNALTLLAANLTLPTSGLVSFNRDTATNGAVILTGGFALTGDLTFKVGNEPENGTAAGGSVRVDGVISNAFNLFKIGNGNLILNNTNTYEGITTINRGVLTIDADDRLGVLPGAATPGSIVIDGGSLRGSGTFTLESNRGIAIGSPGASGTGAIDVANSTVLNAVLPSIMTYNGIIADNGPDPDNLTKTGAGTLNLGGANTYGGLTRVNAGALTVLNLDALGSTAVGTVVQSGGTLQFAGGMNYSTPEALSLYGTGAGGIGALSSLSGDNTVSGPVISVGPGGSLGATAGKLIVTSTINRVGPGDINFVGAGEVVLQSVLSDPSSVFVPLDAMQGRLFLGTTHVIDAATGALNINNLLPGGSTAPIQTAPLIDSLTFADDAAFTAFFGGVNPGGSNFTAVFFGTFTAPSTGNYFFAATNNDDEASFWIDSNSTNDGFFDPSDAMQSVDNGNTAPLSVALTAGVTYNIAYAVRDTGGGSSLTGRAQLGGALIAPNSASGVPIAGFTAPASTVNNVVKTGTGILRLEAHNTFTDAITIGAGTVQALFEDSLGVGPQGTSVIAGGTLELVGGITLNNEVLSLSGPGAGGVGALNSTGGNSVVNTPITLVGSTAIGNGAAATLLTLGNSLTMSSVGNLTLTGAGNIDVTQSFGNGNPASTTLADTLGVTWYPNQFTDTNLYNPNPISNPQSYLALTPSATTLANTDTPFDFDTAQLVAQSTIPGTMAAFGNRFGAVWQGKMTVGGNLPAGDISFGTNTDDGSVIYIDINQNGVYEAAELIVSNGGNHGNLQRLGSVNLPAGTYNIYIGYYESSGGGGFEATFGIGANLPYASQTFINPGNASQAGIWSYDSATVNGLIKTGTGTATLLSANNYNSSTTVTEGTLVVGVAGAIPTTGNLVVNGGTLALGAFDASVTGVSLQSGSITGSTGILTSASNFDVRSGSASAILNGAVELVKSTAGTVLLTGANTYSGNTTVNAGTLAIVGSSSLPTTGVVTVNTGGNLDLANGVTATTVAAAINLTNNANLTFDWNAGVVDTLSTAVAASTTGTVGISINPTNSPSGSGLILISAPAGGLVSPNGTLYMLSNNTNFTANLTISDTAVAIGGYSPATALTSAYWLGGQVAGYPNVMAYSLGTTSNWAVAPGDVSNTALGVVPGSTANVFFSTSTGATQQGNIVLGTNMSVNSVTFNDTTPVTIAADGSALTLNSAGTGSSSAISTNQNATINANLLLATSQTWTTAASRILTVGGIVSGNAGLTIDGAGSTLLSGANTYTGITSVVAGSLLLGGNAPASSSGTLGNAASSVLVGGLSGSADASLLANSPIAIDRAITVQAGSSGLATLGGSHSSGTTTYNGIITLLKNVQLRSESTGSLATDQVNFAGQIDDALNIFGVTKTGAGTVNLSRPVGNTYDGGTTVTAGTLLVNNVIGSATGAGPVLVQAAATLGGSGIIGGSVTVDGTLAPGNSIGTLAVSGANALILNGINNFEVDAATLTADLATVGGALTYGGTLKITNLNGSLDIGNSWDLFNFATQSGTFANNAVFNTSGDGVTLPFLPSYLVWQFNYATGVLSITPVLAPTITSITPAIGPTTGGTIVIISGTNFLNVLAVTFDGFAPATYSVISSTEITATTLPHSAGAVEVTVTNTGGSGSLDGTNDFTYVGQPTLTSVVVNGGPGVVFGASTFTLAGQHSVVKQILVTFQEAVTVASDAFTVTRRTQNVTVNGGAVPSTVAVVANSVTMISASEYLVTFSGTGTHAGGVIDSGVYDLTTLASKVTAVGQTMAANQTTTFFAMFGNIEANNRYNGVPITQPVPQAGYSSGDGLTKAFVDPGSLFQFSDTFGSTATNAAGPPAYNIVFDYNLDGAIDPGDLFAFSDSFGIDWNF